MDQRYPENISVQLHFFLNKPQITHQIKYLMCFIFQIEWKAEKMLLKLLLTVNVKEITSILKGICNLSLTIFKVSISKVINWVSKQPFRPVDNIDGAGNSWLWHGCILDILKGDYTDSSIIRAIDKWQSWLYQELLLRHQLLNCSSCFWIYTGHHTTQQ